MKRPRFASTPTKRPADGGVAGISRRCRPLVAPSVASARSSASSRRVGVVPGAHVGPDALAVQVAAGRRVVVADDQVERAAVREVEDLPEDALAERRRPTTVESSARAARR